MAFGCQKRVDIDWLRWNYFLLNCIKGWIRLFARAQLCNSLLMLNNHPVTCDKWFQYLNMSLHFPEYTIMFHHFHLLYRRYIDTCLASQANKCSNPTLHFATVNSTETETRAQPTKDIITHAWLHFKGCPYCHILLNLKFKLKRYHWSLISELSYPIFVYLLVYLQFFLLAC